MLYNRYLIGCIAALVGFTVAAPQPLPGSNWEYAPNARGYYVPKFKKGEEPGSTNYLARFGDKYTSNNTQALISRQAAELYTVGLAGEEQISYGCDTNIVEQVFSEIRVLCGGEICDQGSTRQASIRTLSAGREEDGSLNVKADGELAPYIREAMFNALDALVIPEAVKFEDKTSYGPQISPYLTPPIAQCTMPRGANFYSVVARENDENGPLVGTLEAFIEVDAEEFEFCDFFVGAGSAIAGAMNAAAGAILGVIGPVACAFL